MIKLFGKNIVGIQQEKKIKTFSRTLETKQKIRKKAKENSLK